MQCKIDCRCPLYYLGAEKTPGSFTAADDIQKRVCFCCAFEAVLIPDNLIVLCLQAGCYFDLL